MGCQGHQDRHPVSDALYLLEPARWDLNPGHPYNRHSISLLYQSLTDLGQLHYDGKHNPRVLDLGHHYGKHRSQSDRQHPHL